MREEMRRLVSTFFFFFWRSVASIHYASSLTHAQTLQCPACETRRRDCVRGGETPRRREAATKARTRDARATGHVNSLSLVCFRCCIASRFFLLVNVVLRCPHPTVFPVLPRRFCLYSARLPRHRSTLDVNSTFFFSGGGKVLFFCPHPVLDSCSRCDLGTKDIIDSDACHTPPPTPTPYFFFFFLPHHRLGKEFDRIHKSKLISRYVGTSIYAFSFPLFLFTSLLFFFLLCVGQKQKPRHLYSHTGTLSSQQLAYKSSVF